jgi:peptidoglycan/LPS O-acetylase OafA/YrhL
MGVRIFFVLSGFVIVRLLIREYAKSGDFWIKGFYARRALKIVPPFLFVVTLATSLTWNNNYSALAVLAQHFFFFNWYLLATGHTILLTNTEVLPGSQLVWTLAVEEQFYILIALFWFIFVKRSKAPIERIRGLLFLVFAFSTIEKIILPLVIHGHSDALSNYLHISTDSQMSAIALGGILAIMNWEDALGRPTKFYSLMKTSGILVLLLGITLLGIPLSYGMPTLMGYQQIAILQEFGAFFILASGLFEKGWPVFLKRISELRIVQLVGLASYSIYLSHDILIARAHQESPKPLAQALLVVIVVTIPGLIIHQIADSPMEKYRQRWRVRASDLV